MGTFSKWSLILFLATTYLAASCLAGLYDFKSHSVFRGLHVRQDSQSSGFSLYSADFLDDSLGDSCVKALSASITCDYYVLRFQELEYRGGLGNDTLTDSICTTPCQGSLRDWFNSVSTACAGNNITGAVPTKVGGMLWAGYNETCVKDPKTKKYCNDIIANFTTVNDISMMPKSEMCSICYTRRLAMMQSSQYSVYNENYKSDLELVHKVCNITGLTDIPPPLVVRLPDPAPFCATGNSYTTKKGDTCGSIAAASNVSSAAIYMGNQALIPDCSDVDVGVNICLPLTCQIYKIQPTDTCISVESSQGLIYGNLRSYNTWLNYDCSNLQVASDFYGKIICLSPQGGTFTQTAPPVGQTSLPGTNDGYIQNPVPPPNATVATGTTLKCGKWRVVTSDDTCGSICLQESITISLFLQVNPSLKSSDCSGSLKTGTVLCVGPTYQWNSTVTDTNTEPADTTSTISLSSTSGGDSRTSTSSASLVKSTAASSRQSGATASMK